jgi:hypothetical protein
VGKFFEFYVELLQLAPGWKTRLGDRGPDLCRHLLPGEASSNLEWFGSVLWHQGDAPTPQPCEDSLGNVLLWNGDVFDDKQVIFFEILS